MPDNSKGPTGSSCQPETRESGDSNLEGCLAYYGRGCVGGLQLPEDGSVLAPWVAITFEGSGSTISVGNQSSSSTSPPHVACIQSFEFGYSDGMTCRLTIHDEEGGSFVQFMKNLLADWICLKNGAPASIRMKVQFGWGKSSCPNMSSPAARSPCFYCLSDSIETNFREGKFHFEITGKDLVHKMFEGGTETIYGGEGENAVPITEAIKLFLTNDCPPNVGEVNFYRMIGGTRVPCPFKFGGFEGPKGKWIAAGQDKLRVVTRWLEGHVTDRDKSWIPQYNSEEPNGEIIFWEDPKPKKVESDSYWEKNCIGTFIVNGGSKSNVLEFSPKIRWDFARLTSSGGNLGDDTVNALQTPGSKNPGRPGNDVVKSPCAGHNTQTTNTETQKDNHSASATKVMNMANDANARSLKILTDNIEADLTIVGDPAILPPTDAMWSKNCTIILINPYFIKNNIAKNGNLTSDWLANPTCNEVLSSKAWICKSITHKIEAGKYTTTIGVFLTTPGVDTPAGGPIGAWDGGWTPTTC